MTQQFASTSTFGNKQGESRTRRRSVRWAAIGAASLLLVGPATAALAPVTAAAAARPSQPAAQQATATLHALDLPVLSVPADSRPDEVTVTFPLGSQTGTLYTPKPRSGEHLASGKATTARYRTTVHHQLPGTHPEVLLQPHTVVYPLR
jgi:hypothetical protein